jgi:hypothetical protein
MTKRTTLIALLLLSPFFRDLHSKEQERIGVFEGRTAILHKRKGVTGLVIIAHRGGIGMEEIKKFQRYGFDVLALKPGEGDQDIPESLFIRYLTAASALHDYTRKMVMLDGFQTPYLKRYLSIYDNAFSGFVFLFPHLEFTKHFPFDAEPANPFKNSTIMIVDTDAERVRRSYSILKKHLPQTGLYSGIVNLQSGQDKSVLGSLLDHREFINYLYFSRYRIVWSAATRVFPYGCNESYHSDTIISLADWHVSALAEDDFCPQYLLTNGLKLYRVENAIENECFYSESAISQWITCIKGE